MDDMTGIRRYLLVVMCLPAVAVAQSPCPNIYVQIQNIRNSTGSIACALFESPEGFPNDYLHYATNIRVIKIQSAHVSCRFSDLPSGTYAIGVVHDENMNGKLDTSSVGIPEEGYGFSNDAKALIGVPTFSAASFQYDGESLELTINIRY